MKKFGVHCEHHFSSRQAPSGGTWKYAKAPSTKKNPCRGSLPIDILLPAMSVLVVAQSSSEILEGLMNNPVFLTSGNIPENQGRMVFLSNVT